MRGMMITGLLAALTACATPCPPSAAPSEPIVTQYRCTGNQQVTATFTRSPDQVLIVQSGYPTVTLPLGVSGSGFRYEAEGTELRGRANEAHLTRPGGGELFCRAAP